MPTWLLALVVKPLVFFVAFVFIVALATWMLYRIVPDGRIKQILFKQRSNVDARPRDKAIMTAAVVGFYVVLVAVVAWMGF